MYKIGVVVPLYNAQDKIVRTITAILTQSATVDLRVCVVNDNSIDNSAAEVRRVFASNNNVKLLNNTKNLGVAETRNKGVNWLLDNFKFDYLAFCDSDDIWFEDKLETQLRSPATFNYGGYIAYNWGKDILGRRVKVREVWEFKDCLAGNPFPMSSVLIDRLLVSYDLFPSGYHEDYRAWLNLFSKEKLEGVVSFNPSFTPLFLYGEGEKSVSSNRLKSLKGYWQVLKDFDVSFYMRVVYVFKSLLNKLTRLE
jgi:glycosyltransferase involved in cell wall biosynthesis